MEDRRPAAQERFERRGAEVGLDELEVRALGCGGDVLFLFRARVVVGERVDADHAPAVGEQALGEMRADEPGDAGDESERLHAGTSVRASCRIVARRTAADDCRSASSSPTRPRSAALITA